MARPSISTATGDKGQTGLYGGKRTSKASPRIQAYGDVDELNAVLGLILSEELPPNLKTQLSEIQRTLFTFGADLATPLDSGVTVPRITQTDVVTLEEWGARHEQGLPQLTHFILPRGSRAACLLHQARTVCRRAERWMIHLHEKEPLNEHAIVYLNRLSDYLFIVARTANKHAAVEEVTWVPSQ